MVREIQSKVLSATARTIMFLPYIIPGAAAAIAWTWMYTPNGAVNQLLSAVGLESWTRAWLGDFAWALPAVGFIGTWILTGLCTLLLLSAKLCGYSGERHVPLASVVEFIHTATLLHDDVVDNANLRRGLASANTLWGNEASVLVGDFLFSKSFSLMVADGDLAVLKVMSAATTIIAEGEVLQLVSTSDMDLTEERYIEVVKCKTAILLSAACQAGAILGNADPEREERYVASGLSRAAADRIFRAQLH